jgi:hypothetical protein
MRIRRSRGEVVRQNADLSTILNPDPLPPNSALEICRSVAQGENGRKQVSTSFIRPFLCPLCPPAFISRFIWCGLLLVLLAAASSCLTPALCSGLLLDLPPHPPGLPSPLSLNRVPVGRLKSLSFLGFAALIPLLSSLFCIPNPPPSVGPRHLRLD